MTSARTQDLLSGADSSVAARVGRMGLAAAALPYAAAVTLRNFMFDAGLRPARGLGRTTISVGNLTAGGTGKTPMVIALAQHLVALGRHPAVLLRGYKADEAGKSDEAQMMAVELGPGVPVEADPSRAAAAARVLAEQPAVDVFILDDAFQRRQVKRDLDLVLVDATCPFGFGHVLPRGLLREPMGNLARADAVVVTRSDLVEAEALATLDGTIEKLTGRLPIAHAQHRWTGYRKTAAAGSHEESAGLHALAGRKVAALVGIGNPAAFDQSLRRQPIEAVVWSQAWADHADYDMVAVQDALDAAGAAGAEVLVTTEKDWVKWRRFWPNVPRRLDVYRPVVTMALSEGWAALETMMERAGR